MTNPLKGRSKRERVMLYALAAVVVLGGAMKVMASGGSAVAVDDGTPHAPVDTTSVPPVVEEPADEVPAVVHPKGAGSKRDPFEPRIRVGSGGGGSTTIPDQTTAPEQPGDTVTVQLEDIYPDDEGQLVAQLKLDGTRFKVREGATAAKLVTVVVLMDRCGTFEQGGDTFALCVGQATERAR